MKVSLLTKFMPKNTDKEKKQTTHGSQKRNNVTESFVIKDSEKQVCKVTKLKESPGWLPPIILILFQRV